MRWFHLPRQGTELVEKFAPAYSKEHVMKQLLSKQARLPVVASCLFGFCLLSGCGSGGSVGPVTAAPAQPRQMKKFEELEAKSEAAQKSTQK